MRWLRGPGRAASPALMQRRFTLLRIRFNEVLSQFDLFSDVLTQRSEHETGVFLSGLDVLAADALTFPDRRSTPPEVVCYLDRGPGAAIRRARTRLPGGGESPVAIVRVPRERMVGFGVGASLLHEVGAPGRRVARSRRLDAAAPRRLERAVGPPRAPRPGTLGTLARGDPRRPVGGREARDLRLARA